MEALPSLSCAMNIKTTKSLCSIGNYYKPKFSNSFSFNLQIENSTGETRRKNKQKIASSSSTTQFFAATKEDWKPINNGNAGDRMLLDNKIGEAYSERLLEDGIVFQEIIKVRSFEVGSDYKMSIGALLGYLQDTALNHHKSVGLTADGFGSSTKMIEMNAIWIMYWSHIEVDCYPSWGDVVQVETWRSLTKPGVICQWRIRDSKTRKILIRATNFYLMMNKKTRRFCKLEHEILEELKPYLKDTEGDDPVLHKDSFRLPKLDIHQADYFRTGLSPGWTDVDTNNHVSHIKLATCVLESVPRSVVETHQLSAITLNYKRECHSDSVLQSFSKLITNNQSTENQGIDFDHSLCFESGQETVRGRTLWKPKFADNSMKEAQSLAGATLNGYYH